MNAAEFDLHAALEDRHWWFRARREIILCLLKRNLPSLHSKRILEIGCGTGGNLRLLSRHCRAMGTEIDPYAAQLAKQRAGCEIRCGNIASTLTSADPAPDAVLMLDVLEHVMDDQSLLLEALAILPVGGLLVITVPADEQLWSQHDIKLGHFRRYTQEKLAALWQQQPVELVLLSGFNSLLYPLVRIARRLKAQKTADASDLKPVSPLLNFLLYQVFASERHLLPWLSLPWGCSLVAILRKSRA